MVEYTLPTVRFVRNRKWWGKERKFLLAIDNKIIFLFLESNFLRRKVDEFFLQNCLKIIEESILCASIPDYTIFYRSLSVARSNSSAALPLSFALSFLLYFHSFVRLLFLFISLICTFSRSVSFFLSLFVLFLSLPLTNTFSLSLSLSPSFSISVCLVFQLDFVL